MVTAHRSHARLPGSLQCLDILIRCKVYKQSRSAALLVTKGTRYYNLPIRCYFWQNIYPELPQQHVVHLVKFVSYCVSIMALFVYAQRNFLKELLIILSPLNKVSLIGTFLFGHLVVQKEFQYKSRSFVTKWQIVCITKVAI